MDKWKAGRQARRDTLSVVNKGVHHGVSDYKGAVNRSRLGRRRPREGRRMTGRIALLDYADDVLDGRIALGTRSARTAALLARLALEDWLDEQSASWCADSVKPPTAAASEACSAEC